MDLERDLEFLYEIGSLRFVQRAWRQFHNPNFQNFPEHSFRIVWIAMVIARRENVGDINKIVKMALLHDLPESRTGDADYLNRLYTEQNETKAINDIFNNTSLKELTELWQEYRKMECIEAKIVKDADNLDVDFELQEQFYMGNKIRDSWAPLRKNVAEKKLFTKTAKEIWDKIYNSNPHDWHLHAPNRHSTGDWCFHRWL